MTTDTKFGLDISLGTASGGYVLLRVLADENGAPQYEEEDISGAEVLNASDGEHFSDVFDSWHLGGFLAEHVQNGFYNQAVNVDCTEPGKIRPAPRRIATTNVGDDPLLPAQFGVSGMIYDPTTNRLFVLARYATALGSALATGVRVYCLQSSHAEDGASAVNDVAITTTAGDAFTASEGITDLTPLISLTRGAVFEMMAPLGNTFRPFTYGALGPAVALAARRLLANRGRIFRLGLSTTASGAQVGASNCDIAADYTTVGNWSSIVTLPVYEPTAALDLPAALGMDALGEVPFFGTYRGLFALVAGGFPVNQTPALATLPIGKGTMVSTTKVAGGIVAGLFGRGTLLWTNGSSIEQIGPSINPLMNIDPCIPMCLWETPNGNLWARVWYPGRTGNTSWEMWMGVKNDKGFAWHTILANENATEGGPLTTVWDTSINTKRFNQALCPFYPVYWPNGTPELAIGTGHSESGWPGTAAGAVSSATGPPGTLTDTRVAWTVNQWAGFTAACNGKSITIASNTAQVLTGTGGWSGGTNPGNGAAYTVSKPISRVLFVHGGLFFDDTLSYEDGSLATVTVQWRSGRFSRHDNRVFRHWTDIRFLGENIGAVGALGGRILVEVSFDGGAFGNPGGGSAIYLTSNDQLVTLDNYARDVEIKLTWQLDGLSGTAATAMRNAPATTTLIQYEGREVPNTIKRITMLVDSDHPAQAGGTRVKRDAKGAMTALETTAKATVKQTFRDPFKVNRTVSLLKMKKLSLSECKRMKVPEGALRLVLLESV